MISLVTFMKFIRQTLIFSLFLAILIWPLFYVKAGPPRDQTFTFVKDADNPTLDVGAPGSWEGRAVFDPNVLKESEGVYKMYYVGWDSSFVAAIGLATSADGIHWTKYPGNPVMTIGPVGAYDHVMWEGEVRKEGDVYKMWYQSSLDGVAYKSNYATSPNGITWTKYEGNPIIEGGAGKWDQDYVGIRSVLKIGDTYHAWYEGSNLTPSLSWNPFGVGYATSSDGIHWTKISVDAPVLSGSTGEFDEEGIIPSVARVGNLFVLFSSSHINSVKVGMATSVDGINWTKYPSNTVYDLQGTTGEWDAWTNGALISNVVESYNPAVYRLYYRGQNATSVLRSGGVTLTTSLPGYPIGLEQYKSDGTTAIAVGGATNNTTAVLKFSMSSGVINDLLTPQVEIREINTPFTGEPTNSGTPVVYAGSNVTGEVTVTGLTNGKSYHWQAITNNAGGNRLSSFVSENGNEGADFSVDNVAPEAPIITSVTPDNIISYSEQGAVHVVGTAEIGSTVSINAGDDCRPLGHVASANGLVTSGNYDLVFDLSFFCDGPISFSVTATDAANNTSEQTSLIVTKNILIPEVQTLSSGGSTLNGNVTYANGESIIDRGFQYGLNSDYDLSVSIGTGSNGFFGSPTNTICNRDYHFRAYATNENGVGYGLDNTFYSGSCTGNRNFNFPLPKLLSPWWSFSEDKTDSRKLTFTFKVEDATQLAISASLIFSGISWQDFESNLNYYLADRSKNNTVFIKFRSRYGTETIVYPMNIPPAVNKIINNTTSPDSASKVNKFIFNRNLNLGSRGNDVKQLQEILKQLKFFPLNILSTNYYGLITKKAVSSLQKYYDKLPYSKTYNLKPYPGNFGSNTRKLLNKLLSEM